MISVENEEEERISRGEGEKGNNNWAHSILEVEIWAKKEQERISVRKSKRKRRGREDQHGRGEDKKARGICCLGS